MRNQDPTRSARSRRQPFAGAGLGNKGNEVRIDDLERYMTNPPKGPQAIFLCPELRTARRKGSAWTALKGWPAIMGPPGSRIGRAHDRRPAHPRRGRRMRGVSL